jgi:FkbM family methyltransferase
MIFTKIYIRIFKIIVNKLSIYRKTKYVGTNYGGWFILEDTVLKNGVILSAGVGEDISFDIDMLNQYQPKIILVDPTPKAIEHIELIKRNLGIHKTKEFSAEGKQPVEAYDLKNIKDNDLFLIEKALYKKSNLDVKFYSPPNENHVSHSISNWQNNYKKTGDFISVKTICVLDVLKSQNLNFIDILKLDIEGAEIEVISNILKDNILPNQLLVEFDELHNESLKGYLRATIIFLKLLINGYRLVKTSRFPNFLFYKI